MTMPFVIYTSRTRALLCRTARRGDKFEAKDLAHWAKVTINVAMMSVIVWTLIVLPWLGKFVFLYFFVVAPIKHELLGHYRAAKMLGIPIEEVGLGIPEGWTRQLMFEVKLPWFPCRVMLSPFLFAAYVIEGALGRKILKTKSYVEQAWFLGAGVITHMADAALCYVLLLVLDWDFSLWYSVKLLLAITVLHLFLKVLTDFPGRVAAIMPFLGVGIIVAVTWLAWPSLAQNPVQSFVNGEVLAGQVLGPVSAIKLMSVTNHYALALLMMFILSLGLAMTNMLPFKFLDGGQILEALLEKWRVSEGWRKVIILGLTFTFGVALVGITFRAEFGMIGVALIAAFLALKTFRYTLKSHRHRCSIHNPDPTPTA